MRPPLATPLKARGLGTRCHLAISRFSRSRFAGESSQQRHGSAPQLPSILATVTSGGRAVCMNVSKSVLALVQPEVRNRPSARGTIREDPKERPGYFCRGMADGDEPLRDSPVETTLDLKSTNLW